MALPLRILGAFIPGVGKEPENKFIDEARPRFWTIASAIAVAGLVLGGLLALSGLGEEEGGGSQLMLAAFVALASSIVAAVIVHRRPMVHSIRASRCARRGASF